MPYRNLKLVVIIHIECKSHSDITLINGLEFWIKVFGKIVALTILSLTIKNRKWQGKCHRINIRLALSLKL